MGAFDDGMARGAGGCLGMVMGAVALGALLFGCVALNVATGPGGALSRAPADYSTASFGADACGAALAHVERNIGGRFAGLRPGGATHLSGTNPALWRCEARLRDATLAAVDVEKSCGAAGECAKVVKIVMGAQVIFRAP